MRVFYLHGFASSARSSKAAFLAMRLAERGLDLVTPDFNEPAFETLTVTRMVGQVADHLARVPAGEPVLLIGSSLGAYVALLAAVDPTVTRLVLLAPALEFAPERLARVGDRTMEEWRRTGTTQVFHYGFGRTMPLAYDICADVAERALPPPAIPTLVFQGRRDTVVDPAAVERWAAAHPERVRLVMLDDDHQLAGSLEAIWREIARVL